jgi:hypothetical protein
MTYIERYVVMNCLISIIFCCCQCSEINIKNNNLTSSDISQENLDKSSKRLDSECEKVAGNWTATVFDNETRIFKMLCEEGVCDSGILEGTVTLECRDGKLSGSILRGFFSYPPPGREDRSILLVELVEKELTLEYENSAGCKIKHKLHRVDENFVGEFTQKGCKIKALYETEKEFRNGIKGGSILSDHYIP